MYIFSFEKLEVWQLARHFVGAIYHETATFPDHERFGMTSQIRRAAISIISNIAEGNSRQTGKEKARFFEIAYSSINEVLSQIIIAHDLGYISEENYNSLRKSIEELSNKLNALYKAQMKRG